VPKPLEPSIVWDPAIGGFRTVDRDPPPSKAPRNKIVEMLAETFRASQPGHRPGPPTVQLPAHLRPYIR
jgi:hypothetical protein